MDRRTFLAAATAGVVAWPGAASASKPRTTDLEPMSIDVTARPITTFGRASSRQTFGRLTFRGGLSLSSDSEWFGGWSGLTLGADGRQILAVSDAGAWLSADMIYADDRPMGFRNARIGPILALNGSNLRRDRDRDAESIALLDGTLDRGTVVVAFEQNTRIGRFSVNGSGLSAPAGYLPRPQEARRLQRNRSLEAVAVLQGGRRRGQIIAFAERYLSPEGHHTGWIWSGNRIQPVHVTARQDYDITDAAGLPDGGLVILERYFGWLSGVAMRLRYFAPTELDAGKVLVGETLLEADMSYDIDNMEGVSAHVSPSGETVLTLMSDDNFNGFLQRSILLQFTLDERR